MHWIHVTNDQNRRIWINLAQASSMNPSNGATAVYFIGSETDRVMVRETPEEILAKEPYELGPD